MFDTSTSQWDSIPRSPTFLPVHFSPSRETEKRRWSKINQASIVIFKQSNSCPDLTFRKKALIKDTSLRETSRIKSWIFMFYFFLLFLFPPFLSPLVSITLFSTLQRTLLTLWSFVTFPLPVHYSRTNSHKNADNLFPALLATDWKQCFLYQLRSCDQHVKKNLNNSN